MGKKIAAWLVWFTSLALALYDWIARWLGRFSVPDDFGAYVIAPLRDRLAPFLRALVAPVLTWEAARWGLLIVASLTLLWVYVGNRILVRLRFHPGKAKDAPAIAAKDDGISRWIQTDSDTGYWRNEFKDKVIDIERHVSASRHLMGVRYDACTLVGPAVLCVEDSAYLENILVTDARSTDEVFIVLTNDTRPRGLVYVREGSIKNCHLIMITFAGTAKEIESARSKVRVLEHRLDVAKEERESTISQWRAEARRNL